MADEQVAISTDQGSDALTQPETELAGLDAGAESLDLGDAGLESN